MIHERSQLVEKLPFYCLSAIIKPILSIYPYLSSGPIRHSLLLHSTSHLLCFHSQGYHWSSPFTHFSSSAIFLLHLFSLSLSLSGISLMRTGKWGTNETLNPRHRKRLRFGINVCTISHTLYWQVYKCVLLSTWQHPDKSGNIQGGPVLTGLNMHQFSCKSWSWCSLPFCPGGTSCNNPNQNGNAKLNPYRLFGLTSVFVLPKTQTMIKVMLLTMQGKVLLVCE